MTNERIESLPASVLDLDIGRHNDMLNLYNSIFGHSDADKTQLPCEFCGDLFPVDTLIMHQVRMQSSHKTVHQYCMSTLQRINGFCFHSISFHSTLDFWEEFVSWQFGPQHNKFTLNIYNYHVRMFWNKDLTLSNLDPSITNSPCIFIIIVLECSGIRFFVELYQSTCIGGTCFKTVDMKSYIYNY